MGGFSRIMINTKRLRVLKEGERKSGPVVYWMSRDQRTHDNWALLYAQEKALEQQTQLIVIFCITPSFLNAPLRHYDFMLKGLVDVQKDLYKYNIPLLFLMGEPAEIIPQYISENKAGLLITDFDPLKIKQDWKKSISEKITIPFVEVDAHNIVPCFYASPKQEFAAYTFRPKINRLLPEFLIEFPELKKMHGTEMASFQKLSSFDALLEGLDIDRSVKPVDWIKPGEENAIEMLNFFIENKLSSYNTDRNIPLKKGQSDLSPYLHFGQISAQRVALNINHSSVHAEIASPFLEELIVRRELADNYCLYNRNYDNFEGFPDWARTTLNEHRYDKREDIYSLEELEKGLTHDSLWNSAQNEMVQKGKMHGYLRMYWAKKILEWTLSPEQAMQYAIYLNDKYELDGRDPNGYTGIAWSIGGVHDRAWGERNIFGKIRYMSYSSTSRKLNARAKKTRLF